MGKAHVIVIGAGFTGVALAYDLAKRGLSVSVIERGPIANGTSGRTHGLLHSGARYAVDDQESAIECINENMVLRKIAPQVIEPNGGLFVGLDESDQLYRNRFIQGCQECHIPIDDIKPAVALKMEPELTKKIHTAIFVPDGTFDPLRLALAFASTAKSFGAHFHLFTEVTGFNFNGHGNVIGVKYDDRKNGVSGEKFADLIVNATGAWCGEVAELAGDSDIPIRPTPGVMVTYDRRLCQRVINRLNEPGDGDIIVPQRQMVTVGTTSFEASDLDYIPVTEDQVKMMFDRGRELIPAITDTNLRGAFMATRPLLDSGMKGRSLTRTFKCFDHKESHNIDGFVTITGGKATTLRLMAEKTADLVCRKLAISADCDTRETPLLSYRQYFTIQDEEI